MVVGGIVGALFLVIKLLLFIGFVILFWNVYVALRIYIKKNSDVNWRERG